MYRESVVGLECLLCLVGGSACNSGSGVVEPPFEASAMPTMTVFDRFKNSRRVISRKNGSWAGRHDEVTGPLLSKMRNKCSPFSSKMFATSPTYILILHPNLTSPSYILFSCPNPNLNISSSCYILMLHSHLKSSCYILILQPNLTSSSHILISCPNLNLNISS